MAVEEGREGVLPEAVAAMEAVRRGVPRVLRGLKGEQRMSDQALGDLVGMSRQAVQARISGQTDIAHQELVGFAIALGTDVYEVYRRAHLALADQGHASLMSSAQQTFELALSDADATAA